MRSSLCRLIYYSRSNLPKDAAAGGAELTRLVKSARRKNEFSVITSLLMLEGMWFVQVLEGDRSSILEAMGRITGDSRHKDIMIVDWRETTRRELVYPLEIAVHNKATDAIFSKFTLREALARGRPQWTMIFDLAKALQAQVLSQQGIDHLLV